MNVFGATVMVILFAILLHVLGLVQTTKQVVAISQAASSTLRNTLLSDAEKERLMQQSSIQLFRLLAVLILRTAVALVAPLAGILTVEGVLRMLARWDFIIAASILGILVYVALDKWQSRNS